MIYEKYVISVAKLTKKAWKCSCQILFIYIKKSGVLLICIRAEALVK